uniref:Uncharacterized protein n=1 Tax=Ditylenchus dipsaci TaxID=166011 RepID=A0A915DVL0_9BILA
MKVPGGGSDHRPFLVYMAIPVVDFRDNFAIHRAVGQYWAELARSFADANIIPLNITIFAKKLIHGYVSDLKQNMEPSKTCQKLRCYYPVGQTGRQISRVFEPSRKF